MRTCYGLPALAPVDSFGRDSAKPSGRKIICRQCDRAKSRAYYAANREKVIARVLARHRGEI